MSPQPSNPPGIELFRTDKYYIFIRDNHSLWWDRKTGQFDAKTALDLVHAEDPSCLGVCFGIVGKISLQSSEDRLLLVRECALVGNLPGGYPAYKIKNVSFLSLSEEPTDLGLEQCRKHREQRDARRGPFSGASLFDQKAVLGKTWGSIKSAGNTIKNTTQQAAALATMQVKQGVKQDSKQRERFERRITEELTRIFTETDSFYFSPTGDITNTLQRQCNRETSSSQMSDTEETNLKMIDDRFFWNKSMLQDIINLNTKEAEAWILPIIQGFVQIEPCRVEVGYEALSPRYETFTLSLISRRSRFRAGTRYKRRGVDEDGKCANYVETEQIVAYQSHIVSFVQVRGSVPVFWSQPGYKYRPPPRIDKGEAETQVAFEKHFNGELDIYGPVAVVNLVEQSGKERIIWDAYTDHILLYNSPQLTYATFDFHEYCRGMHFENVSLLIESLVEVLREMGYCWRDKEGLICSQKGVFRVNCIDCLDRTNVVQTALAKAAMEIQLYKLGLIPPEGTMPVTLRSMFQQLWANNGDIISKQYAGTNALKGDYTRTGERKFTGLMKDGMNSANRYYLNRFKDVYRQATIDFMLGNPVSEEEFSSEKPGEEEESGNTAEHVKLLIEDCKKMLISDSSMVLGAWGLIDADPVTGDPAETEMDTILILTRDSYYVADYDEQMDRVTKYQQVLLQDISWLEQGTAELSTAGSLFKQSSRSQHHCIRIHYSADCQPGYFHMFRSAHIRFFNNVAVEIRSQEEMIESLKAVFETFIVALEIAGCPSVPTTSGQPLEKMKSRVIAGDPTRKPSGLLSSYLDVASIPTMTRNVSETQLTTLKSVGSKALSNMTSQFTKLNRLGQNLNPRSNRQDGQTSDRQVQKDTATVVTVQPMEGQKNVHEPSSIVNPVDGDSSTGLVTSVMPEREALKHSHLPSVGIVMAHGKGTPQAITTNTSGRAPLIHDVSLTSVVQQETSASNHLRKYPLMHSRTDLTLDVSNLVLTKVEPFSKENASREQSEGSTQQQDSKLVPPNTLLLHKHHSHSSGEVTDQKPCADTSNTAAAGLDNEGKNQGTIPNITASKSENSLKTIGDTLTQAITSPSAATAKEIVLSPFSKLAKGMQHLGANLDPRKLKSVGTPHLLPVAVAPRMHSEENHILMERWKNCNTKLIAL
ncbi:phosphatidylinositide phosphatase SAC2 isoform X2 [Thrips palmi]|uniref:Phosphatidylinositide phosphatase SAC2 isoform X2 n=1 Tax=Thrips palmi TaxID=161013 RepID=A0A6P8ZWP5_THRPL|nr:phosphatidylinositide phosphatase SAC2 isoform X2 [Thrips palmi]